MDKVKVQKAVRDLLEAIGEDTGREGLVDTPRRVADMYEKVFSGLHKADEELKKIVVTFHADFDEDEMSSSRIFLFTPCVNTTFFPFLVKLMWPIFPRRTG